MLNYITCLLLKNDEVNPLSLSVCRIIDFCGVDAALTLAFSAIGRVAMVTSHAGLAVRTGGEVTALFAHTAVHTCAVAVTLAR